MLDKIFPKIHNEGYKFIVIFVLITIVLYFISGFLGLIGLILTIWCYYFFRDPERISIGDEKYITSPADDCHVNRSPCSGKISEILYKPGKFFNASLDKASEDNERNYYKIKNSHGEDIIVVQIAGLIARRIVTETSVDEELQQGSRIGMIRFGSRADLYFENYEPLVKINQKTIAGETLIAKR